MNQKINDTSNSLNNIMDIYQASQNGNVDRLKVLINKGIDINAVDSYGCTILILASISGHAKCVKIILKHKGIDINKKCYSGNTALMFASEYGRTECVKILLKCPDIDVNLIDRRYYGTALMYACYFEKPDCVKELLKFKGINIYRVDYNKKNALIHSKNSISGVKNKEIINLIINLIIKDLYFIPLYYDIMRNIIEEYI
jgi:ankyrin repeat protein